MNTEIRDDKIYAVAISGRELKELVEAGCKARKLEIAAIKKYRRKNKEQIAAIEAKISKEGEDSLNKTEIKTWKNANRNGTPYVPEFEILAQADL